MTVGASYAMAAPAVEVPPLALPEIDEWLMVAALLLIVLDIVLGVAQAVATRTLSSSKMRQGLWHKVAYLGAWAVSWVFAFALGYADLGFDVPTVDAVSVYVVLMEGVSCLENLCRLNPDLAGSGLMRLFAGLKGKAGGGGSDGAGQEREGQEG